MNEAEVLFFPGTTEIAEITESEPISMRWFYNRATYWVAGGNSVPS